ncbi:MAG: putative nucleotidyltransferase substrate binding domain-containing protein [Albidovulum sp.]|uniref:putative nucleotidyltransferase substrate binding domain-containing protein n=1 Tax=Albidovulum sp. TaxID=1872424 RepID=UPI003C9439FB
MNDISGTVQTFLETVHPYDALPQDELARVAGSFGRRELPQGAEIYAQGEVLPGLFLIEKGGVEILDANGALVSLLGPRNSFGERGLMRDGRAATTARTTGTARLLVLPVEAFRRLVSEVPAFAKFFSRGRGAEPRGSDLATRRVGDLMARDPVTCAPDTTVAAAARQMRDAHVSSLGVTDPDGTLLGIVTTRDLSHRVLAEGRGADTPVSAVMTADPSSLPPQALGTDILHLMLERRIGHVPVTEGGRLIGMITQTDLTRHQAVSSAVLIRDIALAASAAEMAETTARIPGLLRQLVGGHNAHEVTTRLITDIADAVTRRLLALAEAELGAPPVPYLWLACGSQGRQEQTGVSDQDNCLMLDDAVTEGDMGYFAQLAKYVTDGLNTGGYVYCPGDMMATNPRWCQPVRVWRDYFRGWIATSNPEAQMLASVMFDLRPIGGAAHLFGDLQAGTLAAASKNSIFTAHMIGNSLKHAPPLGLIRGFATIRSGEHRNQIDMKHSGVVPVTDLARVYALQGRLSAVNTRARLEAAIEAGVISPSGGRDLIEAYDLIAETRLGHQAARVKAGEKPDNFLAPAELSDFERSHLRDAFVVVRTMQSAVGHGKGALN